MAIDSTMFAAQIPAATYAVGDRISLGVIRGPSVVRDGYGLAKLKKIFTYSNVTSSMWKVSVKNSNWVDEVSNPATALSEAGLAETSGTIQKGHNANLTPNSGWQVVAECIVAGTEAADADIITLIDIDYPSVAAVYDPRNVDGLPVTIDGSYSVTLTAKGSATNAVWTTYPLDVLKAGYKYLLTEASYYAGGLIGFMSISGAAGQSGLERIIPCRSANLQGMRYLLDYSTVLVKGPFNLNLMGLAASATTTAAYTYMDFVKK